MFSRFRRIPAAVLCLAVLAVAPAACTDAEPGGGSGESEDAEQSAPSLFDPSASIAVKKGQPGLNIRSGEEYEYAGFETDLLKSLSRELKFRPFVHDIPSRDREDILHYQGVDLVIASYTITRERDKKIDFTAPYLKTYQSVLVRKDDGSIKERGDLKNKLACTASGSTTKSIGNAPGSKVEFRKDYKTCVKELISGNFDAVLTDEIILQGFANQEPYMDDVEIVEDIRIDERQFYGIGLPEGHAADCRKLNDALKKFLDSGWRKSFEQHFSTIAKGDFEQEYKPSDSEFQEYAEEMSCGVK